MKNIVKHATETSAMQKWTLTNQQAIVQNLTEDGHVAKQIVTYPDGMKINIAYQTHQPQQNHYTVETKIPFFGTYKAEYHTTEQDSQIARTLVAEDLYNAKGQRQPGYSWRNKQNDVTIEDYKEGNGIYGGYMTNIICDVAQGVLPIEKDGFSQLITLPHGTGFVRVMELFNDDGRSMVVSRENAAGAVDPAYQVVHFVDKGQAVQIAEQYDSPPVSLKTRASSILSL